jgi:hypothetical protein
MRMRIRTGTRAKRAHFFEAPAETLDANTREADASTDWATKIRVPGRRFHVIIPRQSEFCQSW